jgi:hypothetical protein
MKQINLILTAMLVIALCLTACSKSDNNGPTQKPTNMKALADSVRLSIVKARAGIPVYFDERHAVDVNRNGAPSNILDTTYTFQRVGDDILINAGDVLPVDLKTCVVQMIDWCTKYQNEAIKQ